MLKNIKKPLFKGVFKYKLRKNRFICCVVYDVFADRHLDRFWEVSP